MTKNLNLKFQESVDAFDGIIEVIQTVLDYAVEECKKLINLVEGELKP